MYPIGSLVMYSSNGVCSVADIRIESFAGEKKEYYVLMPMGGGTSHIYVPTDNEKLLSRMRPLLSREEVLTLLRRFKEETIAWIPDNRQRNIYFQQALLEANPLELLRVVKAIFARKEELATRGKKNLMADEQVLKRAERILHGEFSVALGISPDAVPPFIESELAGI